MKSRHAVRESPNRRRRQGSPARSKVGEVSEKFCNFTLVCTSQLNKCASWLCKSRSTSNSSSSNFGERSPSMDMLHHAASTINSSPAGSGAVDDDSQPPARNCFRLIVLGSARVGKTSLVTKFLGGKFEDCYTPTIEDFHRKLYRIRGEVYQLDILDTSGINPFPAMRRLSFLTGDLFLLVFSMDIRESYEEVIRLREQILETKCSNTSGKNKKHLPKVPMVFAGNKSDLKEKSVSCEEVEAYCIRDTTSCNFVEVSAKNNVNIDELFYELFNIAGLPPEMAPSHHKKVTTTFGSPCTLPPHNPSNRNKKTLTIKRRLSDACGVVEPNVRRPSIRTDLLIMRSKTSSNNDSDNTAGPNTFTFGRNTRATQAGCTLQ